MTEFNTITVIGLGYIGLPTAVSLANCAKKLNVLGVDINEAIVKMINQGKVHIKEPDLDTALKTAIQNKWLIATTQIQSSDAFIITVPTPLTNNFQPDLSYIKDAVHTIAPILQKGNLIVLESTSPVGTTAKIAQWLKFCRPDLIFPNENREADIHIAYCPERVLPGKIMQELIECDRIIGGLTEQCTEYALALYQLFTRGKNIKTDARTAEMCKLTENSFRDVNIAFANELSIICDKLNINVWELIRLANHHPRVNILQPGAGVGGHCIAVDPWFIIAQAPELSHLIRTARKINDNKPQWVLEKIKIALADCAMVKNIRADEINIACLGLTFKANTDDLRESPALAITEQLMDWHKGRIFVVEPNIKQLPNRLIDKVDLVSFAQALQQADILVLLVDHAEFRDYPVTNISQAWIIDTRGIWKE